MQIVINIVLLFLLCVNIWLLIHNYKKYKKIIEDQNIQIEFLRKELEEIEIEEFFK